MGFDRNINGNRNVKFLIGIIGHCTDEKNLIQLVLVSLISNFFTNKTFLANEWMSFSSSNSALLIFTLRPLFKTFWYSYKIFQPTKRLLINQKYRSYNCEFKNYFTTFCSKQVEYTESNLRAQHSFFNAFSVRVFSSLFRYQLPRSDGRSKNLRG